MARPLQSICPTQPSPFVSMPPLPYGAYGAPSTATDWAQTYPPSFPIAVDLDGTLFPHHVLWQTFPSWPLLFQTARQAIWHKKPWPWFKHHVSESFWTPPQHPWPIHQPLIKLLRAWQQQGCRLLLVTGSPQTIAETIASGLGIFHDVWHSTPTHHLVGEHKATALVTAFGSAGYTYIGDSWQDPPVWKHSRDIIVVNDPKSRLVRTVQRSILPHQRLAIMPHPCKS
jgi:phosphoserine phosphatase